MKKRIREICAVLAASMCLPYMAAPGMMAYGQYPDGSTKRVYSSGLEEKWASPSEIYHGQKKAYGAQLKTHASPSEVWQEEEVFAESVATPPESEWKFLWENPDSVPGYYRKSGTIGGLYTFQGRDGNDYWRAYGRMEEDGLSGWYSSDFNGTVEEGENIIFPEDEYMTLAPYIYRHASPGEKEFQFLKEQEGEILSRKREEGKGKNPDGSRYDTWKMVFSDGEDEFVGYWFYGYVENEEGKDGIEARWFPCDADGNITRIQMMASVMARAWNPAAPSITRQGNTVIITYSDILARSSYDNSKSKYTLGVGILLNHVSLQSDSYAGFFPETSTVENHVIKKEMNGLAKGLSWKTDGSDGVYTCELLEPTAAVTGSSSRVKLADKITGTKREWYEEYGDESTGFSAVPHVECRLVLTNPSPYITGFGYGVLYNAADGEGGDNNFIRFCVGNVDISSVCQEAHEHQGMVRREPDCTKQGSITGTCTSCGMEVNEIIPALGHQYPEAYDTVTVPGYKIKNCLRCGTRLETVANLYYVEYHGNGNTGGATEKTIHYIDKASHLARNGFDRTGWHFTEWNTEAGGNGTSYQEGQQITNLTLTGDETIHVYACWAVNSYSVTFDGNGGTDGKTITKEYNSNIGTLPSSFRSGYRFDGWWSHKTGGERIMENTRIPASDLQVYAHWTPNTYTIRFEGNGAEEGVMKDEAFSYDEEKELSGNEFKRQGYIFTGWEDEKGNQYKEKEKIRNLTTEDGEVILLRARWIPVTYIISWHGGEDYTGGQMPVQVLTYDKEETLSANQFERTGYIFEGWSFQESGEGELLKDRQKVLNLSAEQDCTIHLYAQWSNSRYKITFLPNSGTCQIKEKEVFYDKEVGELPVPVKEDYGFLGWFHEKTGAQVDEKTLYKDLEDIHLIANWELRFEDMGNGTNRRPGPDGQYDTADDKYYTNGADKEAGTDDDRRIYPGKDGIYGTSDDYYYGIGANEKEVDIHAGQDTVFGTEDDYIDNGDGTNTRPGKDGNFGTEDDEHWWNGKDEKPGTDDDKKINPGLDGEYGTKDDYIDNGDGTNTRPGEDGKFGTGDDEIWENGTDGKPGTEDDKKPGEGGSGGSGGSHASGSSGGSHGSGGSGSSRTSSSPSGLAQEGTWILDSIGWWYRYPDGTWPKDGWYQLSYRGKSEWYHFDGNGYMQTGWFADKDGKIYFLHNISDGTMGRMYKDWNMINGKWYFFNPVSDGSMGALLADMKRSE